MLVLGFLDWGALILQSPRGGGGNLGVGFNAHFSFSWHGFK